MELRLAGVCRLLILLGSPLGLLPINRIKDSRLRRCPALVIAIVHLVHVTLVVSKLGFPDSDYASRMYLKMQKYLFPIYVFYCAFTYFYFFLKPDELQQLFRKLLDPCSSFPLVKSKSKLELVGVGKQPAIPHYGYTYWSWSKRYGILLTFAYFLIWLLDSVGSDIRIVLSKIGHVKSTNHTVTSSTLWHKFYLGSWGHVNEHFGYNEWAGIVLYFVGKVSTLGCVYGNVVAVILCGMMADKFEEFRRLLENALNKSKLDESVPWESFQKEYLRLKKLTERISRFIAPLALYCYVVNLNSLIISIFEWLSADKTTSDPNSFHRSFYKYVSFLYYLFRTFFITYVPAEVNIKAGNIGQLLTERQDLQCSWSMYRFEQMAVHDRKPPGIYLCGTFLVTRHFFLSMASLICTTEIVVLQLNPDQL